MRPIYDKEQARNGAPVTPQEEQSVFLKNTLESSTEQLRLNEKLRYQATLLESVNDAIVASDAQYRLTAWNAVAEVLYGWKAEEVLGRNELEILRTEWPGVKAEEMRRTIAQAGRWRGEGTQARRDGTRIPVEISVTVLHDDSGQISGEVSVNRDITERKRAEAELHRTAQRLSLATESALIGIWDLDLEKNVLSWDKRMYELYGIRLEDFGGAYEAWKEGVHPDDLVAAHAEVKDAIAGTKGLHTQFRVVWPDGQVRHLEAHAIVQRGSDGTPKRMIGANWDITARHRTAEVARRSNQQIKLMLECAGEGIFGLDLEGKHTFINTMAARMLGYEDKELIGQHSHSIWHHTRPDGTPFPAEECPIYHTLRAGTHDSGEEYFWRKNGSGFLVEFSSLPIVEEGNIVGAVVTFRDITERKRAEESMKKLFTAVQQAPDTIVITDLKGSIEYVNPAFEKLTGYGKAEAIGHTPALIKSAEHGIEFYQQMWRSILSGQEFRAEFINKKKNGELYRHEATIAPIKNANGTITHFVSSGRDVTWRKRTEERLMRFTAIIEATSDFVGMSDPHGRPLYINSAGRKMLGLPLDDDLSTVSIAETHPQWAANLVLNEAIPAAIRDGSWLGETTFLSRDGREIPASQLILSHRDAQGNVAFLSTIARDISESKRAEEALRKSEEKFRELFEESKDTIFFSSPGGTLLDINRAGVEMFGYSDKSEILNLDVTHSLFVNPEEGKRYREALESNGFVKDYELLMKRKDGRKIWILETSTAVRDKDGTVVAYRGSMRDVTHLKHLQEQLLHSQKMETIGQLAGGVAHDFNNIMMAVSGYCELLLMKMPQDETMRQDVLEILKAQKQGVSLTSQLLAFSRKQVLEPKVFDLGVVVSNMENLLQRLIGEDIDLRILTRPDGGMVEADPNQMEQVIMNLAINSRDAMPRGGRLTIEISNEELDEEYARLHLDAKPGPHVTLSVSDTGHGIDPETLSHVFEPFFTTKGAEKGTGLGLATVYGIVTQSHGSISVYSEPGQGTTFKIYLPLIGGAGQGVAFEREDVVSTGGSETILLVDDNESIRLAVGEVMKIHGYNVLLAGGGKEALEVSRNHAGAIDLLITDVVMPEMSGRELAQQFSAERAGIKVLYMSGYTDDAVVRHGILSAESAFLQKPAPMTTLLRKIRELLD